MPVTVMLRRERMTHNGTHSMRRPDLTPEVSSQYQAVATQIARARRLRAVHLDVFWWSEDRDT